jgi:AraC-like DNA-binding protein
VSARLDAREFGRLLSATVAPVSVQAPAAFAARLWNSSDGHNHVGRMVASAHVSRGLPHTPAETAPRLVCVFQISGNVRVEQDDRSAIAGPGHFWWFRTDRPYSLSFESDFELVGTTTRSGRLPALWASGALGIGSDDPVIASLGAIVERLERAVSGAASSLRPRFVAHMLDVIDTMSRHAVLRGRPSDLVVQALNDIDGRLGSPDLTPRSVADARHVSLRTLHSAFERAEIGVSSTIRARRLERCRQDLADPALSRQPVAEIGARWGLASPSHFTALFRATYGETPTAYRRHALGL